MIDLGKMTFADERDERICLIDVLASVYPYPKSFFMGKPLRVLRGMYLRAKTNPRSIPQKRPAVITDSRPLYKVVNGSTLILKDNGEYEPLDKDDPRN